MRRVAVSHPILAVKEESVGKGGLQLSEEEVAYGIHGKRGSVEH